MYFEYFVGLHFERDSFETEEEGIELMGYHMSKMHELVQFPHRCEMNLLDDEGDVIEHFEMTDIQCFEFYHDVIIDILKKKFQRANK